MNVKAAPANEPEGGPMVGGVSFVAIVVLSYLAALSHQPQLELEPPPSAPQQEQPTEAVEPASNNGEPSPPPNRVTIEGPVSVVRQESSDQQAQEARRETREWVLVILVFFGTSAAVAAYFNSRREAKAAESQLTEMRKQFATANRAYLSLDVQADWNRDDSKITVNIWIKNVGKTTATVGAINITRPRPGWEILDGRGSHIFPEDRIKYQFARLSVPSTKHRVELDGSIEYHDGFRWRVRCYSYTVRSRRRTIAEGLLSGGTGAEVTTMQNWSGDNNDHPAHKNDNGEIVRDA